MTDADVETKNQNIYSRPEVARRFRVSSSWVNPGERVTLLAVAPLVRSRRILDIGVGAGRTVAIVSLLSDSYVGIDYSPVMVAECKKAYPEVDIRLGDARNLSAFPDKSVDFVFFSFNGIDSMDETGRRQVLGEVHRVLDEGGYFVFSTLNKDGRTYGETPWQLRRPGRPWDRSASALVRVLYRNANDPLRIPRRFYNWSRTRGQSVDAGGWAFRALSALDFSLMNHFVTIARLREELVSAGFDVIAVYESDSDQRSAIPADTTTSDTDAFYAVAQRRAG